MRKLLVALLTVATLVGITAGPAAANPVTGPVYTYTATQAATIHNAGAGAVLDLSINGVTYNDRDTWIQGAATGGTMWGGPNVPKSQTMWRVCWYIINPQTVNATWRLDILWDGVVLDTGDFTVFAVAHTAGTPYFAGSICFLDELAPSAASQVQIRAKLLTQGAGNFSGVYKTTIQAEVYP